MNRKFQVGDVVHVGVTDLIGLVSGITQDGYYTLKGFGGQKDDAERGCWELGEAQLIDPLQAAILKSNGVFK